MAIAQPDIPASTETGTLEIMHLKRYWAKMMAKRKGLLNQGDYPEEWSTDKTLLSVLNIGLEQTVRYLYAEAPSFDEFEAWILVVNSGNLDSEKIELFNKFIASENTSLETDGEPRVLSEADLDFWEENGYVIVRNAISAEDCRNTLEAVCSFLEADLNDPSTWYNGHPAKQGIMVQLFQHEMLEKNRRSPRLRKAFEQVWGRKDIWVSADRVGFNPPETNRWKFPGPYLHWDVSLDLPIPFATQGILYLTDTAANQGAFTLVPGFQHRIEDWLHSLPPDASPREQDLYALGATPIAANAGDFIIWHQALPHGSSPNTSQVPRIVQYINYLPLVTPESKKWV